MHADTFFWLYLFPLYRDIPPFLYLPQTCCAQFIFSRQQQTEVPFVFYYSAFVAPYLPPIFCVYTCAEIAQLVSRPLVKLVFFFHSTLTSFLYIKNYRLYCFLFHRTLSKPRCLLKGLVSLNWLCSFCTCACERKKRRELIHFRPLDGWLVTNLCVKTPGVH